MRQPRVALLILPYLGALASLACRAAAPWRDGPSPVLKAEMQARKEERTHE